MEHGIDTASSVYKRGTRNSSDRVVEQRLKHFLRLNTEIAREKALFRNDEEKREALLMTRPMDSRQAFGTFGGMVALLPPLALVLKISVLDGFHRPNGLILLITAAALVASIVAYKLGRGYVPGAVRYVSEFSFPNRVALWAIIGLFWGAISGAAGGLVIVLVGSIFAGIAGGIVGAIAVPIMVALHSSMRAGDLIETKHFLPIAFGITLSICAFVLGL